MEAADENDSKPYDTRHESKPRSNTHQRSIVTAPAVSAAIMEENYDTTHPKLGIAIIINQVNFSGMAKREGSDRDRDSIGAVLESIGFDVRVFNNLDKKDLLDELDKVAHEDHLQSDCLVVVIMTHGDKDVLYASDKCYPIGCLWEPFLGDECSSLRGKPKLFFVQACRGNAFDKGVKLDKAVTDTVDSSSKRLLFLIPTMADLLVMYSTYDGHYSWSHPINGSWFIQSLSTELEQHAHTKEILQLLTAVSRRVAYQYQSNVPDNLAMDAMKQMPCVVSMLTKAFYIKPK
uniref:Ancaspase-7 n=1 Tax=Anopheles stephensi TaxID=30069 RepID=Q86FL0_ANOST|nr:ancaspase-7 [Anopheles stephensi]